MCSECILRRDNEGDWFTAGIRCPRDRRIATRQSTSTRSSDQLPVDGIGALWCYTAYTDITLTYYTTSISTTRLASTCNIYAVITTAGILRQIHSRISRITIVNNRYNQCYYCIQHVRFTIVYNITGAR